jgi:hypothetical protein
MGMLFNTQSTLDIVSQLNANFDAGNLPARAGSPAMFDNWPLANGTYTAVAVPLRILTNAIEDPNNNWQKWLGHFDKSPNSKVSGQQVAATVGNAIGNALRGKKEDGSNQNFHQIEFFAVPDSGTKISATALDLADSKGDWSKVITIYTNTFDQLTDPVSKGRRRRG